MSTAAELFALAWRYHETGAVAQAEQLYRQVVQVDPQHADAWCFLGVACKAQGKLAEAQTHYRRAIQLRPSYVASHYNLGLALQDEGKLVEALRSYSQALTLEPGLLAARNNSGTVLQKLGRLDDAATCFRQVLRVQPNFTEVHVNLGNVLAQQRRFDEAAACFQQALRLQPDYLEARYALGNLLREQGKLDEAAVCYEQVLQADASHAEAYHSLGNIRLSQDRLAAAAAHFTQAARLRPDYAESHNNLGLVRVQQHRWDEALAHYGQALQVRPDYGEAHWNRALLRLLVGQFEEGWPEYEWRSVHHGHVRRTFSQPVWDGSPLDGRTLLLHAEQGLGDTLHFIRYVALVTQLGGKVMVECQAPLLRLLAGFPGIDHLLSAGSPLPAFDVQASLLSLPGIFRTTADTVPGPIPYLTADAQLVEYWGRELQSIHGFKVGMAWQGNPAQYADRHRSIPLAQFAPLAQVKGVQLISLQKGPGTEQLRALAGRFAVLHLGERLDEAHGAFMDTAAIMKNLDLVISSDTAIPHLAGALGVPVWLALHRVPDWRWLLERDDSPWYPTMRLFRQRRAGDWNDVFQRIAVELRSRVGGLPPQEG